MLTTTGPRLVGMSLMGDDLEVLRSFYEGVFGIELRGEDRSDGLQFYATGGSFGYPDGFFPFTLWPRSDDWASAKVRVEMTTSGVDAVHRRAIETIPGRVHG